MKKSDVAIIHPDHAILLQTFGGIDESFNQPRGSWLNNCRRTLMDPKQFVSLSRYDELASAAIREIDIPPDYCPDSVTKSGTPSRNSFDLARDHGYYVISAEANGNLTLCNFRSGDVIMYARDHCFKHISPLPGFPWYTLHSFSDVKTLREWAEEIGQQWISHVTIPS